MLILAGNDSFSAWVGWRSGCFSIVTKQCHEFEIIVYRTKNSLWEVMGNTGGYGNIRVHVTSNKSTREFEYKLVLVRYNKRLLGQVT